MSGTHRQRLSTSTGRQRRPREPPLPLSPSASQRSRSWLPRPRQARLTSPPALPCTGSILPLRPSGVLGSTFEKIKSTLGAPLRMARGAGDQARPPLRSTGWQPSLLEAACWASPQNLPKPARSLGLPPSQAADATAGAGRYAYDSAAGEC